MRCSSIFVALIVVFSLPPGMLSADDAPAPSEGRADPGVTPVDGHRSLATWDFAYPGFYCATTVDLAPGKVNVSTTTKTGADKWTQLASIGAGGQREDFSAAYDDVNGQVIIHGGRYLTNGMQDTDWFRPLRTYDPALDKWTDRGASKLPAGNVGVWDGPDAAFLTHGGYYSYTDLVNGTTVHVVYNNTFAWLPATQAWSQRANGPTLYHHAAVYDPLDGLMITFGGMNTVASGNGSRDYYYNTMYVYNYTSDKWTQRAPSVSVPPARAYHSAVWDNESGQMIIFGGFSGQAALSDCWGYNYSQNKWSQLTSATPTRYMHAAAWDPVRAEMIICAGRAGALNANDTLVFDPSANTWSASTKLPAATRILTAGAFDTGRGRMVVCGGGDGTGKNQLQDAWAIRHGDPEPEYLSGGSIQSWVLDLGPAFHSIDTVSWAGDMPIGTSIALRFRAHNLNVNSSGFIEMANNSKPTQQGRRLQWNLTLTSSTDRTLSPEVWAVKVEYTLNVKPVANASGPAQAFKRTAVTLSGSATDGDGDELTYLWTKISGPAATLDTPGMPSTTFTPLLSGTYLFSLVASDPFADSPASQVTVKVDNRRPRADAGPDQTGVKNELVTFTGLGTDDDADPLTYEWTQVAGQNISLVQPNIRNLTFVPTKLGNYTFRLVVDDGEVTSAPAIVNATITGQAPVSELLAVPATTWINETVNFSASGSSDADGKLVSYAFDFGDGNKTGWIFSATANHSYARPGTFNASVMVKDDDGFISESSPLVRITVQNRLPVVGASVTPETGNTSTQFRFLVPKGSTYDPDGVIVSYFWDFGDETNSTANTAVHTYKQKGQYEIRFRVTDNWGGYAEQVLDITVVNRPPEVAAAAPAEKLTLNTGLEQLFSADVTDPDQDALTYAWTVNGLPQSENRSRFFFKPDKAGTYRITLSISDGETTSLHEWEVTAKKKPAVVEEVNMIQYAIPVMALIIVAAAASAYFVVRRSRKKDEPVVVYAPPGYKPGDELAVAPVSPYPSPPAMPPAAADTTAPVATAMATAPSESGGAAPMEAIPFAEPVAPSAGGSIAEAAPYTESAEPAPFVRAPSRPPTSYTPPPKSGLSPREPYAEQMWRK